MNLKNSTIVWALIAFGIIRILSWGYSSLFTAVGLFRLPLELIGICIALLCTGLMYCYVNKTTMSKELQRNLAGIVTAFNFVAGLLGYINEHALKTAAGQYPAIQDWLTHNATSIAQKHGLLGSNKAITIQMLGSVKNVLIISSVSIIAFSLLGLLTYYLLGLSNRLYLYLTKRS